MVDHVVRLDELAGLFVVEVAPLPGDVLLRLGEEFHRFAHGGGCPSGGEPRRAGSGVNRLRLCDSNAG